MKPTPRKLALVMAVAGLGLSLGQAAQAKGDLTAHAEVLEPAGSADDCDDAPSSPAPAGWASFPAGLLDTTLTTGDPAPSPSEEDRAAVALAMVLMAEPPSAWSTTLPVPGFATTARWQPSADFRRDYGPGESTEPARGEDEKVAAGSTAVDVAVVGTGRPAAQPHPVAANAAPHPAADIDLDLDLTASAGVDINLELTPVLDLDLSLSPGLDLNLDLSPAIDLRLDQAPVFPTTKLRPLGVTKPASVVMSSIASEPAAKSAPLPAAPVAAAPARAAEPMPTIVVASHADRVMLSLEALLANDDDPFAGRFGARTEEIIVSSHAEKALATLAAICRRGDAELSDPDVDPQSGTVAAVAVPAPAAPVATAAADNTRKPSARQETTARAARHSALGDGLVAVNEHNLDRVRGGFDAGNGLQISFGIERAVYVNGSLVTTTNLSVSDLGRVVAGQGAVSAAVAGSSNLSLLQNGAGNTLITGPVSAATLGTVVQNTLNNQKIQSVTTINATVNSLQMLKAQNFEASMRGALTDALRR